MIEKQKLTAKQRRFVEEYAIDHNATQAAIRAGYSPRTARAIGAQNLAKLNIREAVEAKLAANAERCSVSVESLTSEFEQARKLAILEGQASAAVQATMGKAKIHGLLIGRRELTGKDGGAIDFRDEMGTEEAAKRLLFLLNRAANAKRSQKGNQ